MPWILDLNVVGKIREGRQEGERRKGEEKGERLRNGDTGKEFVVVQLRTVQESQIFGPHGQLP